MTRPSRVQLLLGSSGMAVIVIVAGAAINVAAELTSTMVAPNEKSKW